ncbi:MAG: hypothetical protein FJ116_10590 [Deltaproteobacteria bacterium]|nr:hypothetical protein [Deltaproteobacteria bacterium]
MSWIKVLNLVVFCASSISLAQRFDFFTNQSQQARLTVHPVFSAKGVAPLEGEFTLPSLEQIQGADGFSQIVVGGMSSLGQLGRPSLPTTGSLIAVPKGYRAKLTIQSKQESRIKNVWVSPYQIKTRCDCDKAKGFAFDSKLYEQTELFPNQFIELQKVGTLQSLPLVRIAVNPIQFNAKDHTLNVIYRLKFLVEFIPENPSLIQRLPRPLFQLAQQLAANGNALGASVVSEQTQEKILLVSPENLRNSLSSWVQWKIQKGLIVDYVSFEKAGGTKEALKKFIRDYYRSQSVKPTYLLLVGNSTTLPPFMENTTTGNGEQIAASDYPYSLIDEKDPVPDLLYGRLLADNEQEVMTQTSRWIAYEQNPEEQPWYSSGSVIGSNESGSGLSDEAYVTEIGKNLKNYTYTHIDHFFQGANSATTSNIIQAINDGRSWITYMGHGSGLAWISTNDHFNIDDIAKLTNVRLPFILDVSCSNANYIKNPKPLGKAWVTHESSGHNSGAVAYYGGSVDISWDPPAIMAIGISKAHFEKPVHHLGGTVLAGQIYLSEQKGTGEEFVDNLRWYQLLGDPSLELRTSRSLKILVQTSKIKIGTSHQLLLKVTDEEHKPVAGAIASLSQVSKYHSLATGKTDSRGEVILTWDDTKDLTDSTLTLSGYNITPVVTRITY